MQLLTTTVARWMYALPMAIFGIFHFGSADVMAGYIPWAGGAGKILVWLTGLALIAFAVSLILKKMDRMASLLLAGFLVITILSVHLPGVMGGNESAMPMLLKDLALAGGALTFAGIAAAAGR